MPEPYIAFLGRLYSSYTIALGIGILLSGILVFFRLRPTHRARTILDLHIMMLITALVVGRAFHVAAHLDYYQLHPAEITRLDQGGLDWHGVVWGNLIVMAAFAQHQRISSAALLNAFAPALPIMMFAAWWGCHAASCSYGAEVQNMSQYPAWMVWEGPDIYGLRVPRFYTQSIGTLLALALLMIERLLDWAAHTRQIPFNRFGLILVLLSLGMFGIGFLRGDAALWIAGLRSDQWLDLITIVIALVLLVLLSRSHDASRKKGYDSAKHTLSPESD